MKSVKDGSNKSSNERNEPAVDLSAKSSLEESMFIDQAYEEFEDLSILDVLSQDNYEFLEKQVFIILNQSDINSNKQAFWQIYNDTFKVGTYRFVQIKKSKFLNKNHENIIIQLVDISKSILYDQVKAEIQFKELINATVSHEMRNPINSILFQNKNIKFIIQKIQKTLKAVKSEVKQGNYTNIL